VDVASEGITEPSVAGGFGVPRILAVLEREALPIVVVAAFAVVLGTGLASVLNQDGWLALVSGREIVRHGLPSVDHLTVWSSGQHWTDQQWLGQLALYGLFALGGLRLLLTAHVFLAVGTFALAVVAARRLGGSPRATALVALGAFVPLAATITELRTQVLGSLFFLLTFLLLLEETRSPSRRLWLVFPVLVLWANVHGSVTLGAALCVLAASSSAWRQSRVSAGQRPTRWWLRPAGLAVGSVCCIFVSPYGLSLIGYYNDTLLNRGFGKFVTEWQPTTFSGQNVPVFALAGVGLWLLGRARGRVSVFEQAAFVLVVVGAFAASRNVGWLGLVALLVLPRTFDLTSRPRTSRRISPVALGLVVASLFAFGSAVVAAATSPSPKFAQRYPVAASDAVARALARDPRAKIFADEHFADWLIWRLPQARGRVAYDARFELLSQVQLRRLYQWAAQATDHWRAAATGDALAVVYPPHDTGKTAALRRSGGRVLYQDAQIAVLALPRGFGRTPAS
jgi:hypothetical protein